MTTPNVNLYETRSNTAVAAELVSIIDGDTLVVSVDGAEDKV